MSKRVHTEHYFVLTTWLNCYILQSFSQKAVKRIVDSLTKPNTGAIGMMSLATLAESRPNDIAQHDDAVINIMMRDSTAAAQGGQVLVQLANVSDVSSAHVHY